MQWQIYAWVSSNECSDFASVLDGRQIASTGQASSTSVCLAPSSQFGLQRLALGDAGDVEALEVPVALVELQADPDEQIVEGVAAEAQRQALDGFQLAAPLAIE